MNYENLNSYENRLLRNENPQEFMFNFFNTKFYWKELMKINTKYIERNVDISLLSPYIQNILYTRLNINNIDLLSEEYIIQLVTLLQLTGQYLIYTQKMLEEENNKLKETIINLKNSITDNEKYERIIENLNRQNQEKDFLIKTYQEMIQNGKQVNGSINVDDNNINLKSMPEINYVKKTYYYCNICLCKKFKTQKYLDDHMKRRHYNFKEQYIDKEIIEEKKVEEENYRIEFDEKLKIMKNEFETMINQKRENDELAILNKKLDLLQTQVMSQNYNNIFNYRNILNHYNKKNYYQNSVNKEKKEKSENELKMKYNDLNKKYDDLLKKIEEKEKRDKDFNIQPIFIGEKKIINKEKNDENLINKNINIENTKINIEINENKNITDLNRIKDNKENEKEINIIPGKDIKTNLNIFENIVDKKKTEEDKNILIEKLDKDISKEKEEKEKERNKKNINENINNYIKEEKKRENDNKNFINEIVENDKNSMVNLEFNKENENQKFLTNEGNETIIADKKNLFNSKNKEKKDSINKIEQPKLIINDKVSDFDISKNDDDKKENDLKNKNNLFKDINDDKKSENINKNMNISKEVFEDEDKLKLFYKQFEQRDKACLNKEINNYKKTENVNESNVDINEILKDKIISEEFIKKYRYYDYLNRELDIDELFNSLKKYQNDELPNKIIIENSSQKENNNIKSKSNSLKSSKNNDIIIENIDEPIIEKKIEVVESSIIKGFDLIKSTK